MGYQEHKLLTSQQDQVFRLLGRKGFEQLEFVWQKMLGDKFRSYVPVLRHRPTDSYFAFDFDGRLNRNDHWVEYSPGEQQPVDMAKPGDWPSVLMYVERWLANVERERSTPGLWTELGKQRELLAATEPTGDTDNSPFSAEEQAQIAVQLKEIKELLVHSHQADPRALESRIEQLREASTRMGRRDWLNIFIGGIFTWTLEGIIPPDGVREILALASQTLGHLFGGGLPQLPM